MPDARSRAAGSTSAASSGLTAIGDKASCLAPGERPASARVLLELGQRRRAAGPAGARAGEDPRLRQRARVHVQRAGRDHHEPRFRGEARHPPAALATERVREAFGLGRLVTRDLVFPAQPAQRALEEQVARVTRAGRLAAARAVTVIEARHLARRLVAYGAAQAAPRECSVAHASLPLCHWSMPDEPPSRVPGWAAGGECGIMPSRGSLRPEIIPESARADIRLPGGAAWIDSPEAACAAPCGSSPPAAPTGSASVIASTAASTTVRCFTLPPCSRKPRSRSRAKRARMRGGPSVPVAAPRFSAAAATRWR